jgi:hypothetical protein
VDVEKKEAKMVYGLGVSYQKKKIADLVKINEGVTASAVRAL